MMIQQVVEIGPNLKQAVEMWAAAFGFSVFWWGLVRNLR